MTSHTDILSRLNELKINTDKLLKRSYTRREKLITQSEKIYGYSTSFSNAPTSVQIEKNVFGLIEIDEEIDIMKQDYARIKDQISNVEEIIKCNIKQPIMINCHELEN